MHNWRLIIFFLITGCRLSRCSLGCPAPRSPENGLSFIFRSGRLVKYSCHPGFTLIGHAQAECLNNQWNKAVPECVAGLNRSSISGTNVSNVIVVRPLFEWDSSNQKNQQKLYGEGAKRLPLINGIWDKTRRGQDNRSTDALVNQEINIASVRHSQQQEVRRSRLHDAPSEWRQQQLAEARRRPDTLYARSRSASSYQRAFPVIDTRRSSTGHVTTLIHTREGNSRTPEQDTIIMYDLSCLQSLSIARLLVKAPKISHAFVHKYERKRSHAYPFNYFLEATYRCKRGYMLQDVRYTSLRCQKMAWVGHAPKCRPVS